MNIKVNPDDFRIKEGSKVKIKDLPNKIDDLYNDKDEYKSFMEEYTQEIGKLQEILYAHDKYAVLLIFQGMDACGKDSAVKHVMSGINPAGVHVSNFKRPNSDELDHDYMWRTTAKLPERGRIGIFNRSYYEEVLVVRVHPEILSNVQRIPEEFVKNPEKVWKQRYEDIRNFEQFLHRNGTLVLKFFLNVSKDEQRDRLLDRIAEPDKNWKMEVGDIGERKLWPAYMDAFESMMRETSTDTSPWFAIPADGKKNARLIISSIILSELKKLHVNFPVLPPEHMEKLNTIKEMLEKE